MWRLGDVVEGISPRILNSQRRVLSESASNTEQSRNNCSDEATIQATVTAQTDDGPEQATGTLTLAPGAAGRVTGSYVRFLGYNAYPTAMSVSFTVDGIDVPA